MRFRFPSFASFVLVSLFFSKIRSNLLDLGAVWLREIFQRLLRNPRSSGCEERTSSTFPAWMINGFPEAGFGTAAAMIFPRWKSFRIIVRKPMTLRSCIRRANFKGLPFCQTLSFPVSVGKPMRLTMILQFGWFSLISSRDETSIRKLRGVLVFAGSGAFCGLFQYSG